MILTILVYIGGVVALFLAFVACVVFGAVIKHAFKKDRHGLLMASNPYAHKDDTDATTIFGVGLTVIFSVVGTILYFVT